MLTTQPFKEEMEMPRTWFGSILISPLFLRLFEEIDNVVAPVCALWAGWRSGISCPPFSLGQEKNPPSIARRCTVAHFSVQTCLLKSRYRPPPTPSVPCARTYVDLEATNGRSILIINRSDSWNSLRNALIPTVPKQMCTVGAAVVPFGNWLCKEGSRKLLQAKAQIIRDRLPTSNLVKMKEVDHRE